MTDGEPVGTIEKGPDGRFKFAGDEPQLKRLASLYSELAVEAHGHDPDKVTVDDVLGVMLQRMRGHRTWAEEAPLSRGEKYGVQARTAAALAIIEHRLEEMDSGADIEGADDTRASLAELADDPEELSKALGTVDLAWVAYGTSRSGKTRWRDEETHRLRYQKTRPGEHTEKRQKAQADAAKGAAHLDKIVKGNADADDLRGLAEHVGAMTRKQLVEVRRKLRSRFKNGATRDQMVAALRQHVAGKIERGETHVPEPEKKEQKGPSESLAAIIRRRGGIDPKSLAFLASYSGVKEAIQDGIPLGIFKTGGAGLDAIAQELESSGHFQTPDDRHAPDYLLELIKAGVDSAHKDATAEYEQAWAEYNQALEEAHGEHTQAEVDEAIRSGEAASQSEIDVGEGDAGEGQLGEGGKAEDDFPVTPVDADTIPEHVKQAVARHPDKHLMVENGDGTYTHYAPGGSKVKTFPRTELEKQLRDQLLEKGNRVAVMDRTNSAAPAAPPAPAKPSVFGDPSATTATPTADSLTYSEPKPIGGGDAAPKPEGKSPENSLDKVASRSNTIPVEQPVTPADSTTGDTTMTTTEQPTTEQPTTEQPTTELKLQRPPVTVMAAQGHERHRSSETIKLYGAKWDAQAGRYVIPDDKIEAARADGWKVEPYTANAPVMKREDAETLRRYGLNHEDYLPYDSTDLDITKTVPLAGALRGKYPHAIQRAIATAKTDAEKVAFQKRLAEIEADPATAELPVDYSIASSKPGGTMPEKQTTWGEHLKWRATPNRTHLIQGVSAQWVETDDRRNPNDGYATVKHLRKGDLVPGVGVVTDFRRVAGKNEYLVRPFTKAEKLADEKATAEKELRQLRSIQSNPDSAFMQTPEGAAKIAAEIAAHEATLKK